MLIVIAPAPGPAQQETFEEVINVVEVEIPVQVMNNGQPVGGLTRENFRIFDRGEEREVVGFRVVDLTTTTIVQEHPLQVETIQAFDLPSERFFLTVIDTVNSERDLLARAVASLRDGLLERMHPSDRAGVVIYNSRGPQLILGFTRDRQDLETAMRFIISGLNRDDEGSLAAAEALQEARATNLADLAELIGPSAASALSDPGVIDTGNSPTININLAPIIELDSLIGGTAGRIGGSGIEEAFAIGQLQATAVPIAQIEQLAESLQDLATLLGRIKGQKHLLLLTGGVEDFDSLSTRADGFSNNATAGASRDWTGGASGIGRSIKKMADAFRRTGWQIDSFSAGRQVDTIGGNRIDPSMLGTLASETGGKLYSNFSNPFDAFSRLIETTSVTYYLTFHCEDLHADRDFRRLKVDLVDGPRGANVQARDGYYGQERGAGSTALETRLDEAEDLLYGPDRHDFPVRLSTLQSPTDNGQTRISLLAWTDGRALLESRGDSAQLAVHAVARKPQSNSVLDLMAEFPRLDLLETRERSAGKGIQFVGDLVVPEGTYDVRFRIANRSTGEAFLQTLPVTVTAPEEWSLVGPMVLQSPGQAPVLMSESSANLGTDLWSPFTSNGRMFVPGTESVLSAYEPLAMHLKLFGEIGEEIYFEAWLRSAAGGVDLEMRVEVHETHRPDREGAPTSVLVTLPPVELDPGRYELEILWHDGLDDLASAVMPVIVHSED
jgi:VWFA-related protein